MAISPNRTKRLRDLMENYDLSCDTVAELTAREVTTVYVWRNGDHNSIPETVLQLLEMKVAATKKPKVRA